MGGFFDEDNRKFEKTLIVFVLLVCVYVSSYVLIRRENTSPCEYDGCYRPIVTLPGGTFYAAYAPLILLDERLTNDEFKFI